MHHSKEEGFSLVELLVSVAIFTIVMTVAAGALITMLGVNLKNRSITVATNNLNVAVESMSRGLQQANGNYTIGSGGSSITFTSSEGGVATTIVYQLVNVGGRGVVQRVVNGNAQAITGDGVNVTRLNFRSSAFGGAGGDEGSVLLTMEGEVGDPADPATFSEVVVQTTIGLQLQFIPGATAGSGAGNPYTQNIYCPFPNPPSPGMYVVHLENMRIDPVSGLPEYNNTPLTSDNVVMTQADHWDCTKQGRWRLPRYYPACGHNTLSYYELNDPGRGGEIPPGTYDMYVATFDTHCDSPGNCDIDDQRFEQGYVELYNSAGVRLFDPLAPHMGISEDVPGTRNMPVDPTFVGEVTLAETATKAASFHAFYHRDANGNPSPLYSQGVSNAPQTVRISGGSSGSKASTPWQYNPDFANSFVIACAALVGPGEDPMQLSIPIEVEQF